MQRRVDILGIELKLAQRAKDTRRALRATRELTRLGWTAYQFGPTLIVARPPMIVKGPSRPGTEGRD